MVIYTDIKPLIVAGFVLLLINSNDSLPLPQQRKTQDSGSNGRLTMLKKSCVDSLGNKGICMFKWDCISQKGVTLSTCVDGFLFGACCSLEGEAKDKLTSDSYTKTSTDEDYEKSNAISLITLSYLERTKSAIQKEEIRVNHTSTTNFNEYTEILLDDLTVDSLDLSNTSTKITLPPNATSDNVKDFEYSLELLPNVSTSSNNSYLYYGQSKNDNFGNEGENNTLATVFKDDISKLEPKLGITNYSSINLETTQYYNDLKEVTSENVYDDYLSTSEALANDNGKEISESDESLSSIATVYNNTENNISSETTQSKPSIRETIQYDLFTTENDNFEFRNQTQNYTFFNSTENFIGEKYIKWDNSSISSKDKENSTSKDIAPLVWDNYTSLLPSSFQALISQLTSREASGAGSYVLPTTQSNLTINNLFSNKTEKFSFLYDSNWNNSIITSKEQEWTTSQNTYQDENDNSLTTSTGDTESKENLIVAQSADVTGYVTPTTAFHPINNKELINGMGNLYVGVTYYSSNTDMRGSSDQENNEVEPAATFSKHDPTQSLDILNSDPTNESNVPDSKENELKVENCSKYPTKSANEQHNKLYSSSQSNLKEMENPTLSYIKSTLTPYIISNYENEKILTTVSLESGTKSSLNKEILLSKNLTKISSEEKDKEHVEYQNVPTDLDIVDIDSSLDQATILSSSFDNEEFLFDITTEVLTYFTKAEVTNPDSSKPSEMNYGLTTSELDKNDTFEVTKDNLFTPSQITTEQMYSSSPVNIKLTTEIRSNFSGENYEEGPSTLPVFSEDFLSTIYKIENSLETEHTKTDFEPTKNLIQIHSTTGNHQYQGDVFYETSVLEDFNASLNVHLPNTVVTPQNLDLENRTTISPYKEETNYSFIESYQSGNNNVQTEPSVTLNLQQNIISIYNTNATESLVNTTISVTTENISFADTLSNQSNHPTTIPSINVYDVIFNTDSTSAINMSSPLYNETSSESYSMPPALGSSFSPVTETFSTSSTTTQAQTSNGQVIKHKWDYKKDCGVRPMHAIGRIVGGRNTYFGKWPWQALVKEATWLGLFVKNKCGGVLITSKYVLTAAHCQPGFLASLLVVLGTHDISNLKDNGTPVIRNVKRMVVHRHYNPQTFENDLALLEMDTELEFLPHVVPICLPHRYEDFTGEMAFVTGWGKLTHGGDVPNILQEVQVPIVENSECQMMFYQAGHHKAIQNNFVCAGYTNGGQDSCEGDSGGPLMVQRKDKRWVLVGTVSHGIGCADPNLPGVYMRMSSYRPWIDSIINK